MHHLYELSAYRQPKSGPTKPPRGRAVRLSKRLKQAPLHFGGNANAGVAHLKAQQGIVRALRCQRDAYDNLTSAGELHRIAGQVREDLPQTPRVARHPGRYVSMHETG